MTESASKKFIPFAAQGVHFLVPDGFNVRFSKLPKGASPITFKGSNSGRIVLIFEFHIAGQEDKYTGDLPEPAELWVQYTYHDEARAGGNDKLQLVLFDGSNWNLIPGFQMFHGPPGTGGVGYGIIEHVDPAVGWFP